MALAEYIFKKKIQKLAGKVIENEQAIDGAADQFLASINWGQLLGLVARKLVGLLK